MGTNKKLYATRNDLLSIIDKDDCLEFNSHIKELLKEQYLANEIDITSKLSLLDKCNQTQLELLKSIGIDKSVVKEWSRSINIDVNQKYWYIERKVNLNFGISCATTINGSPKAVHTYPTEELAEQAAFKFNTIQLMENWVRHHAPDWNPNWGDECNVDKYGIELGDNSLLVDSCMYSNYFVFQISVPSKELAEAMLREFKYDLEKIFYK